MKKATTPDTGSECFVRYGRHDDHLMLTGYGYPETKTPFVLSQEMEIEVPDIGVIHVRRRAEAKHNFDPVPPQLEGLGRFLPQTRYSDENRVLELASLRIPPVTSPNAMKRILRFLISKMNGNPKNKQLSQAVRDVEKQIIDVNRTYYQSLSRDLEAYGPTDTTVQIIENLKIMSKSQLKKLDTYKLG